MVATAIGVDLGGAAEETLTVRMDPRIQAKAADLDTYYKEVKRLYGMQCSIDGALAKIGSIASQMNAITPQIAAADVKTLAESLRKQLNDIEADLEPRPNDPEHQNLRRRLNWLVGQVRNSGLSPVSPNAGPPAVPRR